MSIIMRDIEYETIKNLGQGGYGRVLQVKSKSDHKYYAIKEIIIKDEMKDKIKDIQKEIDILSKFNSNNIIKYYDSYLDKDKFYILMEYCDGLNLIDFINKSIKNNESIEENILYKIIKQICIGIKEIHNKNILHRDIKPENIFINEKMEIKLGDFVISKYFNPKGSIYYIAPEIIINGIYNEKSDMYSLGCIIYELLNLRKYYDDKEKDEIKMIDSKKYNNKWQEIINSLLVKDYNKRMNINQVYDIILNEINNNYLNNNSDINSLQKENAKKEAFKRISQEFKHISRNPFCSIGYTIGLFNEDNIFEWKYTVLGPKDTPYHNGIFHLKIIFPEDYPQTKPEIIFLTPIYHLNVSYQVSNLKPLGHVDLHSLNMWKPEDSITKILIEILAIFHFNNPDSAYDDEYNTRKNEFINNRTLFEKKAKYFTKKYANPFIKLKEYPNGWDFSFNEKII